MVPRTRLGALCLALAASAIAGSGEARAEMEEIDYSLALNRLGVAERGDPAEMAALHRRFLDGEWGVFGVWAVWWIAHDQGSLPLVADTPHGAFWSRFLRESPPAERRDFLRLLLRSRMADPEARGLEHVSRPGPVAPSSRKWLLAYLEAFPAPAHSADPREVLEARLARYGHLPDERMVRLAGLLGLDEALPSFERVLAMRRRFHVLYTDYSTSPQEVDGLLPATLHAMLRLGARPASRPLVEKALRRARAEADKPQEVAAGPGPARVGAGPGERIWLEILSDGGRSHHVSKRVEEAVLAPPAQSKKVWLDEALARLAGGKPATNLLAERSGKLDGALWEQPFDNGPAMISGDALLLAAGGNVYTLALADGAVRTTTKLGGGGSQRGMALVQAITATPSGDPALLAEGSGEKDRWSVVVLDRETGEVRRRFACAEQSLRSGAGPTLQVLPQGLLVYSGEGRLTVQDEAGRLLGQRTFPDARAFGTASAGRVAVVDEKAVELMKLPGLQTLARFELAALRGPFDAASPAEPSELRTDAVLLSPGGFHLFGRAGGVGFWDDQGKLGWRTQKVGYVSHWARAGEVLFVEDGSTLLRLDGKGQILSRAEGTSSDPFVPVREGGVTVSEHGAFLAQPGSPSRRVGPAEAANRIWLLGATDELLVVQCWRDQTQVSAWRLFPRE